MKLTIVAVQFVTCSVVVSSTAVFRPYRMSYASLVGADNTSIEDSSLLQKALSEVGIVSVTGIPNMDRTTKQALSVLHACALHSKSTQEHVFPDGTVRLTLATHSLPGEDVQKAMDDHQLERSAEFDNPCDTFRTAADAFRSTVTMGTRAFANRVTQIWQEQQETPLLTTANGEIEFYTFSDVVEFGQHLEHFHSYRKLKENASLYEPEDTIDMHVDQGLLIAFVPGRWMMNDGKLQQEDKFLVHDEADMSSGFSIELNDGSIHQVEFNAQDDLVFMLGDGVNQYINNKLSGPTLLRAVPHTLRMDQRQDDSMTRVWYGRMVLPPNDAIHPTHGKTFRDLRESMVTLSLNNEEIAGFGCSGGLVARDLSATDTCQDDSTYCWHRCLNNSEYGISNAICAQEGLEVFCVNPRGQSSTGDHDGDYFPACADAATIQPETPPPTLENYPRSQDNCTDAAFQAFANSSGFEQSHDLPGVGGKFMWNIVDNEVHGRVAFNGLFGWLGFGFANEGGELNGMLGANVLVAIPGGNFSSDKSLDIDLPPSVNEYEIDRERVSFRYWMTPIRTGNETSLPPEVEFDECFTAMTFKTASIGKYKFNLSGSDELLWAANGQDSSMTYHGPDSRGRFAIDWPTSEVTFSAYIDDDSDGDQHNETGAAESASNSSSSAKFSARHVMPLVVAFLALFFPIGLLG